MLPILTFASESDKNKFEYIYEKYKRLLWVKANDILKDHALAEDAVSEAFMRVYKHLQKIEDPDSNRSASYLVTIVRNISINLYHREKRTTSIDIADYNEADEFDLEKLIESNDEAAYALKLVDRLREEQKAVFLLKYAHDMSHREIAGVLGITENNVTVRLHRAKAKLLEWAKEVRV